MSLDRRRGRRHLGLRALRKSGLLGRVGTVTTVTHSGREISVPIVGGIGLQHRAITEPQLEPALRASLAMREGTFVDVGAHLGETLIKLLAYGEGQPYLGFEPNVRAAAYVEQLLAANPTQRGWVVAVALSDRRRVAELRLESELDSGASIVAGFRAERRYRERRVTVALPGDEIMTEREVAPVGVLKIDTEGAELDVLRGCAGTLERDRPLIHCEILPIVDDDTEISRFRRTRADELVAFAVDRGYVVVGVAADGELVELERIPGVSPAERADPSRNFLLMRDYVLMPSGDRDRFMRLSAATG